MEFRLVLIRSIDAIMATLPKDKVTYLFDGLGLMLPTGMEISDAEGARQLYQSAAEFDLPMAGPFENERWAFDDWGMTFEGLLSGVLRGSSLPGYDKPLDPDKLYLVSWRTMSLHPMTISRRQIGRAWVGKR